MVLSRIICCSLNANSAVAILFSSCATLFALISVEATPGRAIDVATTSFDSAWAQLTSAAIADTPKECLLVSATASGSSASADVQRAVAGIRGRVAV
jgi:hypothetical protein